MIGTDLVVGYLLCVGAIDAVEKVIVNDLDASTISGVTVTTYLGMPTQTADPTLTSAIAGYNDSMRFDVGNGLRGIAYIVLRITNAAAVGGWPRLRATIRGRKVYDPRSGLTAYSDNSALCMGDLITDLDYGLGLAVGNLTAAANWCDGLLADGVSQRCRLALTLSNPQKINPGLLDLMSAYAECWYTHEGASIKLVPDGAVDLGSAPQITNWIAGSLSVRREDSTDTPTSVVLEYLVPRSDALPWDTTQVERKAAGQALAPAPVRMPGVYRLAEADNKAISRLVRMQNKQAVRFSLPDSGVIYQAGDVVVLNSAPRGVTDLAVRVHSVDLSAPGRHAISGEVYSADQYPSETPPSAGATVPAGGIILWSGGATPGGWADFTAPNGKLIVGAGGTYAQGATGGTGWDVSFSGNTTTDGAHSGGSAGFPAAQFTTGGSSGICNGFTTTGNPAHAHTHSSGTVTLNPLRRQQRLIKASGVQPSVPQGGLVLGLPGITAGGWLRQTTHAGRTIEAAASDANVGSASQPKSITTGVANDAHEHHQIVGSGRTADFAAGTLYAGRTGGGDHTHTATLNIVAALKRRRLALYGGAADEQIRAGQIILWDGGAPPTDWLLCDGTSGTPDMRDYFIEIAGSGNESTAAGDNTATATATTSSVGHQHKNEALDNNSLKAFVIQHSDTVTHTHTINASAPVDPPHYALACIMYSPGA